MIEEEVRKMLIKITSVIFASIKEINDFSTDENHNVTLICEQTALARQLLLRHSNGVCMVIAIMWKQRFLTVLCK